MSLLNDEIECLFIEIEKINAQNIIIGCVYHPPSADIVEFNNNLSDILNIINLKNSKLCLITGDFNLDLIKADTHVQTCEFLNIMTVHSFVPTIHLPTRITEHSATLIDNIFVNSLVYKSESAIVYNDISDHLPVLLKINLKMPKKKQ